MRRRLGNTSTAAATADDATTAVRRHRHDSCLSCSARQALSIYSHIIPHRIQITPTHIVRLSSPHFNPSSFVIRSCPDHLSSMTGSGLVEILDYLGYKTQTYLNRSQCIYNFHDIYELFSEETIFRGPFLHSIPSRQRDLEIQKVVLAVNF